MTAPLTAGFPDWGRTFAESQVLEVNDHLVTNTAPVVYPIRYMGNAKALMCYFNPTSFNAFVSFSFYADALGSVLMDSYTIEAQQNDKAPQPVPILGPYMGMTVDRVSPASLTYSLLVWRVPEMARFAGGAIDPVVFSQNNTGIPAGTTQTFDSPFIQEGPAVWVAQITGGSFAVELQAVRHDGVVTDLDRVNNDASPMAPRLVYLPPWHIRVSATNFLGTAQNLFLYMTRRKNI